MQKNRVPFMFAAVLALASASVMATGTPPPPPPPAAPPVTKVGIAVKNDNLNANLNANTNSNTNVAKGGEGGKGGSAKSNSASKAKAKSKSTSKAEIKNSGNSEVVVNNTAAAPVNVPKNTPDVNLGAPASGPCNGFSGAIGVSGAGFGIGANTSTVDKGCERREMIRILAMIGEIDLAKELARQDPMVSEAVEALKKKDPNYKPPAQPAVVQPEVTDPYIRARLGLAPLPVTK